MNQPSPKSRKRWRRVIGVVAVVFAGMQLIPTNKTNPPVAIDMIGATAAPEAEAQLLRAACYDCHSHETRWPWYASVAPVSWWTGRHVREGRAHLNLSDWPQARPWEAKAKLESIAQALRADTMPPRDYRLLHPGSRLTSAERNQLAQWVQATATNLQLQRQP